MIERAETLGVAVGISKACQVLGVPRSRIYRERMAKQATETKDPASRTHLRALKPAEKVRVRETLNSERFQDQAPRAVYATLLDEGEYLCHWRTMYRILDEFAEVRERRNQRMHPAYQKPELLATGPNQMWSWDTPALAAQVQVLPS